MNAPHALNPSAYADRVIAALAPECYRSEECVGLVTAIVADRIGSSVGMDHVRLGSVEAMVRSRIRIATVQRSRAGCR